MVFLQKYWFEVSASLFWIGITLIGFYIFYKNRED
jgi:hypothetical protein